MKKILFVALMLMTALPAFAQDIDHQNVGEPTRSTFYLNIAVNDSTLGYLPDFGGWYETRFFDPNDEDYQIFEPTADVDLTDTSDEDLFNHYHFLRVHTYPHARFLGWNTNAGFSHNIFNSEIWVVRWDALDTVNIEAVFAPVRNGDTLHYCNNTAWDQSANHEYCRFTDTTTYFRWGVKFDPNALIGVTQIPRVEVYLGPDSDSTTALPCTYTIQLWQGGEGSPQTLIHSQIHHHAADALGEWLRIDFNTPVAIDNTQPLWVVISTTFTLHDDGWTPLYSRPYCGNPNSNYIWTTQTGWTHYKKDSRLTQNGIQQFDPYVNYYYEIPESWAIRVYSAIPQGQHVTIQTLEGGTATGDGLYNVGSTATLTAIPDDSYCFKHWMKAGDDTPIYSNPYSFTVSNDVYFSAIFSTRAEVMVSSHSLEYGTATGGGEMNVGSTDSLQANVHSGYVFDHWEWYYKCNPSEIYQSTDNPVNFIVDGDVIYTAFFSPDVALCHITVQSNNEGGWVTGGGIYPVGEMVYLTASPYSGYHFLYWKNDEDNTTYAEDLYVFTTLPGVFSFTAYFESNVGIDDRDSDAITVHSLDGCIIVEGADGEVVTIYDMAGRCVRNEALPNGVYTVKVGNRVPRKVAVAR